MSTVEPLKKVVPSPNMEPIVVLVMVVVVVVVVGPPWVPWGGGTIQSRTSLLSRALSGVVAAGDTVNPLTKSLAPIVHAQWFCEVVCGNRGRRVTMVTPASRGGSGG